MYTMKSQGIQIVTFLFCYVFTGVCSTFTCYRPTTPCDTWNGRCQTDGSCFCSHGAWGKRCEIPATAKRNGGTCTIFNHCTMGTCHDDGTTPGCDCPDGYYGTQCELPMVLVECDTKKMWINIVPYGYDKVTWVSFPPLTGDNFTCALEPVDAFFKKNQQYYNSEWRGFAGIFPHVGDSCAGNPIILRETATHITYGRIVYLAYRAEGPDPTDQTLRLTCDVRKPPPPRPPPTPLPPRAPLPFPAPQSPRASFPPRAPLPFPAPQSPRAPLPFPAPQSSRAPQPFPAPQSPRASFPPRAPLPSRAPRPTPAPRTPLSPAQVKITFWTPQGYPMRGSIKLGAKIHVYFELSTPNRGGYDDAQIQSCHILDTTTKQQLPVVERGCVQRPVGELLYKNKPGLAVLHMTVYRLPGMTSNLSFKCQVRVCRRNIDRFCSQPAQCGPYSRGKRSTSDVTETKADNLLTVESKMDVTV